MMRRLVIGVVLALVSICSLHAQSVTPAAPGNPIKAIYTPQPVYQAEWVKRGLTGKGVVLVTIDKETGKVTGPQFPATVRILAPEEWPHAKQTIHRKYWLARVPFVWSKNNVYLEIVVRDNQAS